MQPTDRGMVEASMKACDGASFDEDMVKALMGAW